MASLTDRSPSDDPLEAVIGAYLQARGAGREPDRRAFLTAYPELAPELERFFADHDAMERLARPLRDVAIAARVDEPEVPDPRLPIPVEFGGYVLLEVLGTGGMGIVYRAHHRALGRDVALKQILAGPTAVGSDVRRFRNEAEAAARLRHPNIVAIHDVGEHQGRPYLTMALIEGGSLADRPGRFLDDPRAAARLMTAVAGAVHHAHERGILHRDLKPSNILLDGEGRPHVTDFGLARRIGEESTLTDPGAAVGSPPYMAPEQAAGRSREITTRTDVYGLGAILYALLAGRPPFRGETPLETMDRVRSEAPEPPRRLNPRVDRDLETICLKCLEKEPDRRYASASEVGEDLDRWLAGRPIRARRAGWLRRAALWARRRPYTSASIAGAAMATAMGLVAVVWQWREAVAARRGLEVALYESRIALADRELSAGEPGHALQLLEECPPALRGWEWRHLRHHRRFVQARVEPLNPMVFAVAYHPGGGMLATGHDDGTVAVWELRDDGLTLRQTLRVHDRMVPALAFTPDGRRLISAGHDGVANVWDAETWAVRSALGGKPLGGLWGAAIHPDGRRIALAGIERGLGLWEPETGKMMLYPGHTDRVTGVAVHPGGRLLASSSDDATVRIWDVATGREVRRHNNAGLFSFKCVAFSPDGGRLAAGDDGGTLILWETGSGREIFRRSRQSRVIRSIAFDPDGRRLATVGGSDRGVTLWDAATGRDILSLHGHPGEVWGVAFAADGRRLASAGFEQVRVWDAPRDGDGDSAPGFRALDGHAGRVDALGFSADGRRLATASWDRTVIIWDPATGRPIRTLTGPAGGLTCVAIGPGGRVAASGRDRTVTIWDAGGAMVEAMPGHGRNVGALAISPDGRWLASGGEDRVAILRDATRPGLPIRKRIGLRGFVYSLAFRPDGGELAIAVGNGTVVLEDVAGGRAGRILSLPRLNQHVTGLAYRPDGRALAFGTLKEGVQVWDPSSGRPLAEFRDHDGEVLAVAYSPDGRYLASGGVDRTVRIRDASDGSTVRVIGDGAGEIRALAFSPDGRYFAATGGDRTVRVWDLRERPLSAPDEETSTAR